MKDHTQTHEQGLQAFKAEQRRGRYLRELILIREQLKSDDFDKELMIDYINKRIKDDPNPDDYIMTSINEWDTRAALEISTRKKRADLGLDV